MSMAGIVLVGFARTGLLLFALGDGLESARFTALGLLASKFVKCGACGQMTSVRLVLIAINLAGSTLTANLQQNVLQSTPPAHVSCLQADSFILSVV